MKINQTNENGKNEVNFMVGGTFKVVEIFEKPEEASEYIRKHNKIIIILSIISTIATVLAAFWGILAYYK